MESENLIESLIALVNEFDFAKMMPELDSVMGWIDLFVRLCVLAAPVAVLFFGLWWLILPPKEANHHVGYRCFFGMGSEEAWRFTQRFAGLVWAVVGLVMTIVMAIITGAFPGKPIMDIISSGITCLFWEIIISLISIVFINVTVMLCFNSRGYRRRH